MRSLIAAALMMTAPFAAGAATVEGSHYDVSFTFSSIADARGIISSATGPTATFEAMAIDFPTAGASTDLATWLGSNGSVTGGTSVSVGTSVFLFEGLIKLDAGINDFSVFSDDGFDLLIDGTSIGSFDGNRSPATSLFTHDAGAGGVFDFELLFWDGPGGVTSLTASLNGSVMDMDDFAAPVPLPAGLPLMLVGLAGLGLAARRRKS